MTFLTAQTTRAIKAGTSAQAVPVISSPTPRANRPHMSDHKTSLTTNNIK